MFCNSDATIIGSQLLYLQLFRIPIQVC